MSSVLEPPVAYPADGSLEDDAAALRRMVRPTADGDPDIDGAKITA